MRENEFDQTFRELLTGHSSEVPQEMWRRIKGEKDDRRGFIFWRGYAIALSVLIIGMASYLFFAPSSHTPRPVQGVHGKVVVTKLVGHASFTTVPISTYPAIPINSFSVAPSGTTSAFPAFPAMTTIKTIFPGRKDRKYAITALSIVPEDHSFKQIVAPPLPKSAPGLQCPIMHKKVSSWSLSGYASPDLPFSEQRSGLSYSAGLRLEKTFKEGFSFIVGIQFSRINLAFRFDSTDFGHAGHFNNIDLPLLIGYEKEIAGFKAAIHAGVIYNIHSYPGGPHYIPLVHAYQSHNGFSGYLGISLIKPVNDRFDLFAEPYFRYQPPAPSGQNISTCGVLLGIKYKL